jgi:AhpC/TSA antioxidant enzyme
VANRRDEFAKVGIDIVAVSMSKAESLDTYLKMIPWPIPVYADPERTAYAALGLGKTTVARLLRPGVVLKYLSFILRGWKVRRVPEGEDPLQLGGDVLIGRDRRLLWIQRGTSPVDRPSVEMLLKATRGVIDAGATPA